MLWLFFSHACLIRSNSFFILGVICIINIIFKIERRVNKDGKMRSLPLILLLFLGLLIFYIKDNFTFASFFFISENMFDQVFPSMMG
mmetsp:Transcript_27277/g.26323  ORF Transcript_27277/g.26323 Transcript_27277/m.26323 type:complete len:87 (-) Transcript_27277:133-393(-)